MKKKHLFCLIGGTGTGKNLYLNFLNQDTDFIKECNLSNLVYGTTRSKRDGEIDGDDYHFYTNEEYEKVPKEEIIESRCYYTINGKVYYFTKSDYININMNIICTASPYQYESYYNWCKLVKDNDIDIHMIFIYTNLRNRIERIMNYRFPTRTESDKDLYEMCRRIICEKDEFENVSKRIPELINPLQSINVCHIDNNCDIRFGVDGVNYNLEKIKKYIKNCIKYC